MTSEFNFFQHWYPLSPVEDIDPNHPTAVTLLGLRLVIWQPKASSNYRVFLDQCPHRLAPLSEGRIDENSGHLMCSYHGWEFDRQGICTNIPQAENPDIFTKNQASFACVTFPCRQENGLLWVWPDLNSQELAEETPLPLSPQIDENKGFVWSSYVRDMAYDWQTLIENIVDPSHVPFAHHGVQGKRSQGKPISLEIVQSTPNLIEANIERGLKTTITFEPPCRVEYAIQLGDGTKRLGLVVYCLPVTPGQSRIVAQFPRNFAKILHQLTPRWWNHLTIRHLVLEGDMVLLNHQEYYLQQKQAKDDWKTAYKLPTKADRFVIEFRRWFDLYCHGQLPWKKVGIKETQLKINDNRQELLKRSQIILLALSTIFLIFTAIISDELRHQFGLALGGLILLFLALYSWLKLWLEPRFYFIDYVHADKK